AWRQALREDGLEQQRGHFVGEPRLPSYPREHRLLRLGHLRLSLSPAVRSYCMPSHLPTATASPTWRSAATSSFTSMPSPGRFTSVTAPSSAVALPEKSFQKSSLPVSG